MIIGTTGVTVGCDRRSRVARHLLKSCMGAMRGTMAVRFLLLIMHPYIPVIQLLSMSPDKERRKNKHGRKGKIRMGKQECEHFCARPKGRKFLFAGLPYDCRAHSSLLLKTVGHAHGGGGGHDGDDCN